MSLCYLLCFQSFKYRKFVKQYYHIKRGKVAYMNYHLYIAESIRIYGAVHYSVVMFCFTNILIFLIRRVFHISHILCTFREQSSQKRVLLEKPTLAQLITNILCLLWDPTVHCCLEKSPPLGLILSQLNPVHNYTLFLQYTF